MLRDAAPSIVQNGRPPPGAGAAWQPGR